MRLVASDLDGTLLLSDTTRSSFAIEHAGQHGYDSDGAVQISAAGVLDVSALERLLRGRTTPLAGRMG